jgi:class 3 adenylate cyclase
MSEPIPIDGRRRLAALMFTDMVGFSALVHQNELLARTIVEDMYRIVRATIARHEGTEMDTAGDGFFVQFPSAVAAVECAYEMQAQIHERNLNCPNESRFQIRIGMHLADFIEMKDRVLGDDVNIAARLEKLAEPGGIAISKQLADQVAGKFKGRFKSMGPLELKNIAKKVQVLQMQLPWKAKSGHTRSIRSHLKRASQWLSVVALAVISIAMLAYLTTLFTRYVKETEGQKIVLDQGWEIQTSEGKDWQPFTPGRGALFADDVHGIYSVRTKFKLSQPLHEPAIVLGYIPDRYRIYINTRPIGGANRGSPTELFSFDPGILNTGENELLVVAQTESSPHPGVNPVAGLGSFVSDLDTAYAAVNHDRAMFHGRHLAVFSIAVFLFLATLFGWMLSPEDRLRPYQSIYLFYCVMMCAYYIAPIFSGEPYWLHSMFKVLPLTIFPFMLVSKLLSSQGDRHGKILNNLISTAATFAVIGTLFLTRGKPSSFASAQQIFFTFTAAYGLVSSLWSWWIVASLIRQKTRVKGKVMTSALSAGAFNLLTSVFALCSIRGLVPAGWEGLRVTVSELSVNFPLVFATLMSFIVAIDYTRKSANAKRRQMILNMSRRFLSLLVEKASFASKLAKVQSLVCEQVGAEKSTIFLASQTADGELLLKAAAIIRNREHRVTALETPFHPGEGVLAYVCKVHSPLFIEDLRTDARFSDVLKRRAAVHFYTHSCMVFPLVYNGKLLGVLTLADKADSETFTRQDYELASYSAGILQLMCFLQENLDEPTRLRTVA